VFGIQHVFDALVMLVALDLVAPNNPARCGLAAVKITPKSPLIKGNFEDISLKFEA
jgi:hypothetical protein